MYLPDSITQRRPYFPGLLGVHLLIRAERLDNELRLVVRVLHLGKRIRLPTAAWGAIGCAGAYVGWRAVTQAVRPSPLLGLHSGK